MTQLAFIGAGNMASCIVAGLSAQAPWADISIADHNPEKLAYLAQTYGVKPATTNQLAVASADVVILSVKPQAMKVACLEIRDAVQRRRPLIVTVAAGVETAQVSAWLGGNVSVIRAMPNIPAQVQQGMTGLYAADSVSAADKAVASQIFAAVGASIWVPNEHDMHAITAVSGSGPAYFFMFMEAMHQAAVSMGLDSQSAMQLVTQTALGAATMAQSGDLSPAALRQQVTSPKGTTEQAIISFEHDGLRTMVQQAMIACAKRSESIAEELRSKE
jgi:pyrroline-5-carboxylate reductase